jgi:hypothetical protein
LCDVARVFSFGNDIDEGVEVMVDFNTSTSRCTTRLYNPSILGVSESELLLAKDLF